MIITRPEALAVVQVIKADQGFGKAANRGKSYHGEETGGKPSVPQQKTQDSSSHRNTGLGREEKKAV